MNIMVYNFFQLSTVSSVTCDRDDSNKTPIKGEDRYT